MNNRLELHRKGYSDSEASEVLGITRNCYRAWRSRRGLDANLKYVRKHDHTDRPDWEIENIREFEKLLLAVDDEAQAVGRRLTESSITDVMNYFREGIA